MKSTSVKTLSVTHLSESDAGGGAPMAARKLHDNLRLLGVNSQMIVKTKHSDDPDCFAVPEPQRVDKWVSNRLRHRRERLRLRRYKRSKKPTLEIFTTGRGHWGSDLISALPVSDVYQLHWSHRLIDYGLLFRHLGQATPVVWRMPDMNAFTGGCHYTLGCQNFLAECGNCPQLGSSSERDLSRAVHTFRRSAYAHLSPELLRFVAPSRWIKGEAEKSSLLGKFHVVHIPTGVDTAVFAPCDKAESKRRLGLPADVVNILTVSDHLGNHRKGLDILIKAIKALSTKSIVVTSVGTPSQDMSRLERHISLGRIEAEKDLAIAYNAADVFVLPTRSDNLPNVLLEAMACGVPCISFDVGGVGDAVVHGETGLLAKAEDVAGLTAAIEELAADNELRAHMAAASRARAVRQFDAAERAADYLALYEELLEKSLRHRAGGAG